MKQPFIIALILFCSAAFGQNLVPNSSFEDTIFCPFSPGDVNGIEEWVKVIGSVDYFHPCGQNGYSVPVNNVGNQPAFDGDGYVGLGLWGRGIQNAREFIGVLLEQPLGQDKRYLIRYYLSKSDTVQYALRNFGALFTEAQPPSDVGALLNMEPQTVYEGTDFLDDEEDWMMIEGSFIAVGGEQFLTLGNFDYDNEIDTLFVAEQTSTSAYYYLDDVSVVEDTSYHIGVTDLALVESLNIYPNPTSHRIQLDLGSTLDEIVINVYNDLGELVLSETKFYAGILEYEMPKPKGVYLMQLIESNGKVTNLKVIKI